MKKQILLAVMLIFMVFGAGCSKTEEPQTEKNTLAVYTSSEYAQTEETETVSADNDDITAETNSSEPSETAADAQSSAEDGNQIYIPENQNGETIQGGGSAGGSSSGGTNGSPVQIPSGEMPEGTVGRTESEWIEIGQLLYKEGCDTAFRYLCTGSEFPFDRANLEIIDKTYFLTTCASFDDATKDYYRLFDREYHKNDFDGLLIEQGGRLYAARAARGMDITYLSSEVEKVVSVSDNEIIFGVLVEYEDGTEEMEFSIVPDGDSWKIGKFTLPY